MRILGLRRYAVCLCFLLLGALTLAGPPEVNNHLIKKVSLSAAPGGKEYFDYITIDPTMRRLYLSPGTEVKVVEAEPDADSIIYDPASKCIFSFNGDSKDATVIDPGKGTVVKTVPLGGGPEYAVADGQGVVYNSNEETNEVVTIDPKTHNLFLTTSDFGPPPAPTPEHPYPDPAAIPGTFRLLVYGR